MSHSAYLGIQQYDQALLTSHLLKYQIPKSRQFRHQRKIFSIQYPQNAMEIYQAYRHAHENHRVPAPYHCVYIEYQPRPASRRQRQSCRPYVMLIS